MIVSYIINQTYACIIQNRCKEFQSISQFACSIFPDEEETLYKATIEEIDILSCDLFYFGSAF